MSEMYAVTFELIVSGGPGRGEQFQAVTDAYAALEKVHDGLLDCSFGFSDGDGRAQVDVEVTVMADTSDAAHQLAASSIRSAIQSAGGHTADWADRLPGAEATVYRVLDESVKQVSLT